MPRQIDYYFTLLSPWTYLGHGAFTELAKQHGLVVRYRPTPLRSVFDETGGLPLPKRHPVRQRYRVLELQRWRARRGLPLTLFPKYFPYDVSLADRVVLAIVARGEIRPASSARCWPMSGLASRTCRGRSWCSPPPSGPASTPRA